MFQAVCTCIKWKFTPVLPIHGNLKHMDILGDQSVLTWRKSVILALMLDCTTCKGYHYYQIFFLINSIFCFNLFVEQINKSQWTKVFMRLILIWKKQNPAYPVKFVFLHTDVTNFDFFCTNTSRNGKASHFPLKKGNGKSTTNHTKLYEMSLHPARY